MSIEQLELILSDTYQMDVSFPMIFGHRKEFMQSSYSWLTDSLYLHPKFKKFFDERAGECTDGLYPTVSVRQIMWALKMKPIQRQRWETCFDRRNI